MANSVKENDSVKKESDVEEGLPRENLIGVAVKFLQNPKVQKSSVTHKEAFLKKKGLTDEEVRIAFERSLLFQYGQTNQLAMHPIQQSIAPPSIPPMYILPQRSRWERFKDVVNSVAIVGGLMYGIYCFYKKYIIPFLFGEQKKPKSVEESLSDLDKALSTSVRQLSDSLSQVQSSLDKIQKPEGGKKAGLQIQELKKEISSVKGILLCRHQFPAAPLPHSGVATIPTWQLESSQQQETKIDRDPEETSGSGGSEAEVVTNNGSDSSLEMIREG